MAKKITSNKRRDDIIRRLNEKADDGFDAFADELGEVLRQFWRTASLITAAKISSVLKSTTQRFTTKTARDIEVIAERMLKTGLGRAIRPIMKAASVISYSIGGAEIDGGIVKSFSLVDREAIRFLEEHTMFWSLNHYDTSVTNRIRKLTKRVISDGMSRRDAGLFFKNTIGENLKRSDSYWELTADAIATRGRSMGALSAFERAGVLEYEVDAVIDHRTSDICNYLNKKRFRVSDAVIVRGEMLQATTPEQAKQISPWLRDRDVVGAPIRELAARGVVFPPFHGRCRSRLRIVLS